MYENRVNNIVVRIGMNNSIIGEMFKSKTQHVDKNTLFDVDSVTKIVATTTSIPRSRRI